MYMTLDTLDPILDLSVQLLKSLDVLIRCIPVTTSIGLKECCDHVTESIGVRIKETLLHFRIINECVISILENEVINLASGGRPTHCVSKTFLDFPHAFVSSRKHTFIELGVQKLGTCIKTNCLGKSPDLRIRGGGVSHQRHGLLLVITEALDNLGGIRIVVVRDIRDGNFRGIKVLESDIDGLERTLEEISLLFHHARLVSIECKALSGEELFLKLGLILPATILNGKANIGTV
mmetsp:Transcript_23624/g.69882  ORF Transcript_23624/g.69882 Transcript_23624/m.69882 type:complete len:235 (-) Transcript_23624:3803-4507(-)